ncbi:unnamed protein product [Phytophthora fragariaefolia]|uniref:Unnamed protein product n=1 Tax=Phytophthora fragariaefolia TaxID=1490495 RepID=A0A9W6TTT3_9STRA|nr:unnamed protein product [Phytophthora fragariaefolia]
MDREVSSRGEAAAMVDVRVVVVSMMHFDFGLSTCTVPVLQLDREAINCYEVLINIIIESDGFGIVHQTIDSSQNLAALMVTEDVSLAENGFMALPPNTPPSLSIEVTTPIESDDDQNDGLDFTRVRAELDRLLEEGLLEMGQREESRRALNELDEAQVQYTIDVYKYHLESCPTTKIHNPSAGGMSRSL